MSFNTANIVKSTDHLYHEYHIMLKVIAVWSVDKLFWLIIILIIKINN